MSMRTHELHPSLVHAPLTLVPTAAIFDLVAVTFPQDRRLDRIARRLWWAASASGLAAGLAGAAASQQVELRSRHARDMMFLHGIGNVALVVAALGVSVWRTRNHASLTSAITGLVASGAALYTAYLGGELVYAHGAGVKTLGGANAEAPALFSGQGMSALGRDAVRGVGWLVSRAYRAVSGREKVDRTALGPIGEASMPVVH